VEPFQLVIPADVWGEILAQAQAEQPNECCGLLAGRRTAGLGEVLRRYPLPNAADSPVLYEAESRAHFDAHRDMRQESFDVLAVYHSHPTSAPVPSATDHDSWAHGPEVVCLIVSLTTSPPTVRGWWLEGGQHREASVTVR
jgi:proteasome lid subunit RPN8/RPN11